MRILGTAESFENYLVKCYRLLKFFAFLDKDIYSNFFKNYISLQFTIYYQYCHTIYYHYNILSFSHIIVYLFNLKTLLNL